MADRLAASTNTYHSYSLEEALDGIARAGFRSVELTSVPGWTEHLSRDADDAEIQRVKNLLAQYRLTAVSLSGHSDLVSDEGVAEFRKALDLARKLEISKALIADIGRPNIGINYDPGNVIFYGDTRPEMDLPRSVDKVTHMHVKDQIGGVGVWNFPQGGTGEGDFSALFKVLD